MINQKEKEITALTEARRIAVKLADDLEKKRKAQQKPSLLPTPGPSSQTLKSPTPNKLSTAPLASSGCTTPSKIPRSPRTLAKRHLTTTSQCSAFGVTRFSTRDMDLDTDAQIGTRQTPFQPTVMAGIAGVSTETTNPLPPEPIFATQSAGSCGSSCTAMPTSSSTARPSSLASGRRIDADEAPPMKVAPSRANPRDQGSMALENTVQANFEQHSSSSPPLPDSPEASSQNDLGSCSLTELGEVLPKVPPASDLHTVESTPLLRALPTALRGQYTSQREMAQSLKEVFENALFRMYTSINSSDGPETTWTAPLPGLSLATIVHAMDTAETQAKELIECIDSLSASHSQYRKSLQECIEKNEKKWQDTALSAEAGKVAHSRSSTSRGRRIRETARGKFVPRTNAAQVEYSSDTGYHLHNVCHTDDRPGPLLSLGDENYGVQTASNAAISDDAASNWWDHEGQSTGSTVEHGNQWLPILPRTPPQHYSWDDSGYTTELLLDNSMHGAFEACERGNDLEENETGEDMEHTPKPLRDTSSGVLDASATGAEHRPDDDDENIDYNAYIDSDEVSHDCGEIDGSIKNFPTVIAPAPQDFISLDYSHGERSYKGRHRSRSRPSFRSSSGDEESCGSAVVGAVGAEAVPDRYSRSRKRRAISTASDSASERHSMAERHFDHIRHLRAQQQKIEQQRVEHGHAVATEDLGDPVLSGRSNCSMYQPGEGESGDSFKNGDLENEFEGSGAGVTIDEPVDPFLVRGSGPDTMINVSAPSWQAPYFARATSVQPVARSLDTDPYALNSDAFDFGFAPLQPPDYDSLRSFSFAGAGSFRCEGDSGYTGGKVEARPNGALAEVGSGEQMDRLDGSAEQLLGYLTDFYDR